MSQVYDRTVATPYKQFFKDIIIFENVQVAF